MDGNLLARRSLPTLIILIATALGLYLCYALALPFLEPITWSIVLMVILWRTQTWFEARLGRNLSAAVTLLVGAIVIVVPIVFILHLVFTEAASGAGYVASSLRSAEWRSALEDYPRVSAGLAWVERSLDPAGLVGSVASWLTANGTRFVIGSFNQVLMLLLTFYFLFYLLRDRAAVIKFCLDYSPLTETETREIGRRFVDTVHATIFGNLILAVMKGVLGGLVFWWLGLSPPILWGAVMGVVSIVPVIGAFIVWIPAALFLALQGNWLGAIILMIVGSLIAGAIDNFLYPVLVGTRMELHALPTLVGAIGGLFVFGASGLVLGPAIIAVTLTLIGMLKRRFGTASARIRNAEKAAGGQSV
ncbi:AI-2E family transporter [Pseudaminobacter sp. 19-2017]|uniref:AI-2E family transporter n=1 Tax=Pseudaminobacter soli (ex Zhang et al. 2022) TaxID=2831468 RepID=A0A942DZ61_9HYPH|nr:AI-2E family transporter [Pseudaminobacter soli]MBS3650311.1 AI-2E family transporter [Pseudaminobacter soli]